MDGAAISDLIVSEGLTGLQYPASIDHNCVAMTDRMHGEPFQDNHLRIKNGHVTKRKAISSQSLGDESEPFAWTAQYSWLELLWVQLPMNAGFRFLS